MYNMKSQVDGFFLIKPYFFALLKVILSWTQTQNTILENIEPRGYVEMDRVIDYIWYCYNTI